MKVLGAAFVMLLKMRSSSTARRSTEHGCAREVSRAKQIRGSPCESPHHLACGGTPVSRNAAPTALESRAPKSPRIIAG